MDQERRDELDEVIKRILKPLDDFSFWGDLPDKTKSGLGSSKQPDANLLETSRWLKIIKHPTIILILGARGSGKSVSGYKIAEYLRPIADIYVVALPRKARRLLPEWIGSVPRIEDAPPSSIVLIDESYTQFHSRTSSSDRARVLSNLINLSRQRGQVGVLCGLWFTIQVRLTYLNMTK
jgi:hypothetical protein